MRRRWPYNLDPVVLGALAGMAGAVVKFLLELVVLIFIPSYKSCLRLAGAILFDATFTLSHLSALFLGFEIDLIVSSVAGFVAVEILAFSGRDWLLFKGAGGGALSWVICYATLCRFLSRIEIINTPFLETQLSLLVHIIFGMVVVRAAVEIERRWPAREGRKKKATPEGDS